MTAFSLHAELVLHGLRVLPDGIEADVPDHLADAAEVLQTGVRAVAANRRWFGCGSDRPTAAPRPLNSAAPIPDGITLLCVEGDQRCWDRIDPAARADHPGLFAAMVEPIRCG